MRSSWVSTWSNGGQTAVKRSKRNNLLNLDHGRVKRRSNGHAPPAATTATNPCEPPAAAVSSERAPRLHWVAPLGPSMPSLFPIPPVRSRSRSAFMSAGTCQEVESSCSDVPRHHPHLIARAMIGAGGQLPHRRGLPAPERPASPGDAPAGCHRHRVMPPFRPRAPRQPFTSSVSRMRLLSVSSRHPPGRPPPPSTHCVRTSTSAPAFSSQVWPEGLKRPSSGDSRSHCMTAWPALRGATPLIGCTR